MIPSWRQLVQVGQSWVKLILVGLFCPRVWQEFTESFTVVLVPGYPEQDILHPFTWINVQGLATVHQGVDDGSTHRSIVVPAEQVVLPSQGQRPDSILHKVVVNAEAPVIHIAAQAWQKRERITDGFSDATPVPAEGGSVTVEITTNLDYEIVVPEAAKTWITLVETKALRTDNVTFAVAQNTEATQRTAEVEVRVDGVKVQSFNIVQQAKVVVEEKWQSADLETMYPEGNMTYVSTGPESGTSAKGWQGNQIRFYNNTLSNWKNEDTTPFNSSYTIGLSGNINSPGSMVSPLLSGGCFAIKVLYGYHMLSNSNKGGLSINIKITDAAGKELFKKDAIVEYNPVEQFKPKQNVIQIANFAGLSILGNFIITITNNCPWGREMDTRDIVDVLGISWMSSL